MKAGPTTIDRPRGVRLLAPRELIQVFKDAYKLLKSNDPLLLFSSTAFFTTFALPPILIILIDILKLFFREVTVREKLFRTIEGILGQGAAVDIQTIVDNFEAQERNTILTILISLFFYFVATTLLNSIKQAIHQLWKIARNQDKIMPYSLKERSVGIGMMFIAAALAACSFLTDDALGVFDADQFIVISLQHLISVLIISLWFSLVFKFVPEARVSIGVAMAGGTFTGILFTIGEILLGKFLGHGKMAVIFGVSSTMALLLLFIFYCSFTLYFGAAVTFEYARTINAPIKPGKYAVEMKGNIGSRKRTET
ncbi:MAG TPA: YihY/virulence factor BrkB family protein [Cyclobacteriaceae bacterium]|nr:YihY/virulence factor BrkB family protein [Cyclobacteriaceae bacterium]